jgi:hypothetical protein
LRIRFIPYGGHYGDCAPYHGWVVEIGLDKPQTIAAWTTRAVGGGVWAPGGISYDGHSLFVATTKDAEQWADGEAVIRLGTDLKRPTVRATSSLSPTGRRWTITTRTSAA